MAFVFDATTGGSTTNCYLSVTEADDYFAGRFVNDKWTTLSSVKKQALLVTSTRRIDVENFSGRKANTAQSLQFPRDITFNRDSYPYPTNTIPTNLKSAVCELAYFYLQSDDRILEDIELHDAVNLNAYSVGPLNYQFNGKLKMGALPETVKNELKAIGPLVWLGESKVNQMFR
jgi:hypothetical protein